VGLPVVGLHELPWVSASIEPNSGRAEQRVPNRDASTDTDCSFRAGRPPAPDDKDARPAGHLYVKRPPPLDNRRRRCIVSN
jgi:hypothetical protein